MKKSILLSLFVLLLCACGVQNQQSQTNQYFDNPIILTDCQSNKFVVEHHIGNTFTVKPVK